MASDANGLDALLCCYLSLSAWSSSMICLTGFRKFDWFTCHSLGYVHLNEISITTTGAVFYALEFDL